MYDPITYFGNRYDYKETIISTVKPPYDVELFGINFAESYDYVLLTYVYEVAIIRYCITKIFLTEIYNSIGQSFGSTTALETRLFKNDGFVVEEMLRVKHKGL